MRICFFIMLVIVLPSAMFAAPRPISEVQGDKQTSSFDGKNVTVRGIVTARVRNGFYIQTPDGADDGNPRTSEGILVFTSKEPPSEATIGNLVEVTGFVVEFRPKAEPVTLPITEIKVTKATDEIKVVSKGNALPKPVVLTAVDFEGKNLTEKIEALERYEGMRVRVTSLTVTTPTNGRVDEKTASSTSDGTFTGVLSGTPRPFREPGIEFFETAKFKKELPPGTPVFDMNTETLRVDSGAQLGGQTIDVTSGATVKNLVGVLDYGYRTWTILSDADGAPVVSGNIRATAVFPAKEREFTVAAFNVERLFDDTDDPDLKETIVTREAFQKRLQKLSLIVRDYLRTPDVLALTEVENLATLQKLADKINADMTASGNANFKYEAFLKEGNDFGGIDSGFLVNTARISVTKTEQFYKSDEYKRASDKKSVPVFDRPPFLLEATVKNADKPMTFTVVVNHLKSFRGVFDEDGDTRSKKLAQAEHMARWVQKFQTEKPTMPLMLVGDMNAFQFNDGLVDVIGTIKGKPAPAAQLLHPTEDLVNPDLTNLVEAIPPRERYSYLFAGNAQVLDHFLVNDAAKKHAARFGFARIGADFPEIYRNDSTRAERLSDHDAAIAYFSLDEVVKQ